MAVARPSSHDAGTLLGATGRGVRGAVRDVGERERDAGEGEDAGADAGGAAVDADDDGGHDGGGGARVRASGERRAATTPRRYKSSSESIQGGRGTTRGLGAGAAFGLAVTWTYSGE